jgi:hypothetical protein
VVPTTATSGQKLLNPRLARVLDDQVPPALPSARRRSVWVSVPGSVLPRTQTRVSGKVEPGVRASFGPQSQSGWLVMRSRPWAVPPMV